MFAHASVSPQEPAWRIAEAQVKRTTAAIARRPSNEHGRERYLQLWRLQVAAQTK
jgi:hypothetical protein